MGEHKIFSLLPAIFRDCVGDEYVGQGKNYDMRYPQQIGDRVYASDGRIAVRAPVTVEIIAALPDISPKRFPAANEPFDSSDRWYCGSTPIPDLSGLPRCDECKGNGHLPERRCQCDYETPCRDRGIIPAGPCWDCDGTGIADAAGTMLSLRPDVIVSALYLSVLARHRAQIFLPIALNTPTKAIPARFAGDGFEGLVMPGTQDKAREVMGRTTAMAASEAAP